MKTHSSPEQKDMIRPYHEILGTPAAYSHTTSAEMKAVAKLKDLLDKNYVKPDIKELDKFPNIDGYLEITNSQHIPIGKLEVQIKTLRKSNSRVYQCDKSFLSYCQGAILPVLLIGVNATKELAFWIHLDRMTLNNIIKDVKKEQRTVAVHFPEENVIRYNDNSYLVGWIRIVEEYNEYIQYPELKQKAIDLESQLQSLQKLMVPAIRFSDNEIAEINRYLDSLNHILSYEFKYTQSHILHKYSKVGIAVAKYSSTEIRFMLYPVRNTQNEPLIKELDEEVFNSIDSQVFKKHNALQFSMAARNLIRAYPDEYAYGCISSWVLSSVKHFSGTIDNISLAREYVSCFLSTFHQSLGYNRNWKKIALADVMFKIKYELPFLCVQPYSKVDDLNKKIINIDSLLADSVEMSTKRLAKVKKLLYKNRSAASAIILSSELFNVHLLYYYLNFLKGNNVLVVSRYYSPGLISSFNGPRHRRMNMVFQNLKIFFENFLTIYDHAVNTYFKFSEPVLRFMGTYESCICLLISGNEYHDEPFLEFYFLEGPCFAKRLYFYDAVDINCPIKKIKHKRRLGQSIKLNARQYIIRGMWTTGLDFIFSSSPTYAFIQNLLKNKLSSFFESKHRMYYEYAKQS